MDFRINATGGGGVSPNHGGFTINIFFGSISANYGGFRVNIRRGRISPDYGGFRVNIIGAGISVNRGRGLRINVISGMASALRGGF